MSDSKEVTPQVKESLSRLKVGQMISIMSEYSRSPEKQANTRGLLVGIDQENKRLHILPVYSEQSHYFSLIIGIFWEVITEIKPLRLPKEISSELRKTHKAILRREKLEAELKALKNTILPLRTEIEESMTSLKAAYVKTATNISEKHILGSMLQELSDVLMVEKPSVYFNSSKTDDNEHYVIEIDFQTNTGRGVFSKDSYTSQTEFNHSNQDELIEKYCYSVNTDIFKHPHWSVSLDKEVQLGDKGSLNTKTTVSLTLKKKKLSKPFAEELKIILLPMMQKALKK